MSLFQKIDTHRDIQQAHEAQDFIVSEALQHGWNTEREDAFIALGDRVQTLVSDLLS